MAASTVHAWVSNATFGCCLTAFTVGSRWTHTEEVLEQVNAISVVLARLVLAGTNVNFTPGSGPSFSAHALVSSDFIPTTGSVEARIGLAVVDVGLTGGSGEAFPARADVLVVQVDAAFCSHRTAWVTETLVNLGLTLKTDESRSALADEALELVDAGTTVDARVGRAVVDGVLTLLTGVTRLAGTGEVVDSVNALAVVAARFIGTLVYVDLAGGSGPARMTYALVAEEFVHADTVQARVSRAEIYFFLTAFTAEPSRTITAKVVDQISTVGAQETWSLSTVVRVDFTALAFPAGQTLALVTALLQSHTRCTIFARVSICSTRINLKINFNLVKFLKYLIKFFQFKSNYRNVAINTGVTRSAQTGVVVEAWLVFAHGSLGAGVISAV